MATFKTPSCFLMELASMCRNGSLAYFSLSYLFFFIYICVHWKTLSLLTHYSVSCTQHAISYFFLLRFISKFLLGKKVIYFLFIILEETKGKLANRLRKRHSQVQSKQTVINAPTAGTMRPALIWPLVVSRLLLTTRS